MTDQIIENFINNFINAIENIKQDYYLLKTVYSEQGVQQERIFCYELYHQLRLKFNDVKLKLHGEPVKRGHPDFDPIIPDFIVHQPGTHENNFVIIEVKGVIIKTEIIDDLNKIYRSIDNPTTHYQYGIFLLYRHSFDILAKQISREDLAPIKNDHDKKIYIICSEKEGAEINKMKLSDLRK